MPNTLTALNTTFLGYNVDAIAEEVNSIKALRAEIVPLDVFTTPLNKIPEGVTTISIPVPNYPTGSLTQTGGTSGVNVMDAVVSQISLTIDVDTAVYYPFNPIEAQNNGLEALVSTFVQPAIYGIERTLLSASLSIANTTANFASSSVKPAVASNFTASALTSIAGELSAANINGQRFVLIEPTRYWNGLMANLASLNNQVAAEAIRNGDPNNPFGLIVKECQTIPNLNNAVGFAGVKSSIVLATSIPNVKHANGEAFIYISPNSKLPYLVEQYYDEFRRQWLIGASVLYKAVKGVSGLLRIVSS